MVFIHQQDIEGQGVYDGLEAGIVSIHSDVIICGDIGFIIFAPSRKQG